MTTLTQLLHTPSQKIFRIEAALTAEEVETFQSSTDPTALGFVFVADYVPEPEAPAPPPPADWEGLRVAVTQEPFQSVWLGLLSTRNANAYALLLTAFQQGWRVEFNLALDMVLAGIPLPFPEEKMQQVWDLLRSLHIRN